MKPKPRIYKDADGWAYELPAFGFASPVVKAGYASREAAGKALADRQGVGSGSQLVERASSVRRGPYGYDNWPLVIR